MNGGVPFDRDVNSGSDETNSPAESSNCKREGTAGVIGSFAPNCPTVRRF